MQLSRRQIVEGGLVAGFLGLAAKPVVAAALDQPVSDLAIRRRPDGGAAAGVTQGAPSAAPLRQPHPGQPVPAQPAPPPVVQARVAPTPTRVTVDRAVNPLLVAAARASFERHRRHISNTDVVGIVDFSKVSSQPRFYLLDTSSGQVTEHHVSHGRGSDPGHTGWLQRFSNTHGSLATSEGGYITSEYYHGRYGRSMRVRGLDHTNSNAEARAIVIHPAWYAEPSHLALHGRLGRSEGCFAMSSASLQETLGRLGPGHFLYAARA